MCVMGKGDMISNVQELLNSAAFFFKSTYMAVDESSRKAQIHWFQTLQLELPCLDCGVLEILIYLFLYESDVLNNVSAKSTTEDKAPEKFLESQMSGKRRERRKEKIKG